MIKFLLKKSFFDTWDNLFKIILSNLIAAAVLGSLFILNRIDTLSGGTLFFILSATAILFLHFYAGAVSAATGEAADFKPFSLKTLHEAIKKTWSRSLSTGLISIMLFYVDIKVLSGAMSSDELRGYIPAGVVFWINILWLSALQYVFPFLSRTKGSIFRTLYKSFLLVFDNPGATFLSLLFSLLLGILSVLTFFLIPGLTGILLLHQNLLRILLRKYDWLENKPQQNKKKIPWDQLIKEDSDNLGDRNLKGLIFPWKG